MKNHKVTMLIAGAIIMIGAIAAPAMPVVAKTTETVETAIAEDAGMPEYKYTGSLPYIDAVCEEILAENESLYDKADNGGRYSCSVVRTVGNRRYFEHCREW
jgi:hypothetical protein